MWSEQLEKNMLQNEKYLNSISDPYVLCNFIDIDIDYKSRRKESYFFTQQAILD